LSASQKLSSELQQKIIELAKLGQSNREIGAKLGVHHTTVGNYARLAGVEPKPFTPPDAAKAPEPLQHAAIRKLISKNPLTIEELADALDCGPGRVRDSLHEMIGAGALIGLTVDNKYQTLPSIVLEPGSGEAIGTSDDWTHRFLFTTDNHLCNKHARLDVLTKAYEHAAALGITRAYNAGNWVDGEARFNRTELVTAPGMDNQLDYMIDKWPVHAGIETHFIAGDDHEGWYQQREGIEIGRYLQSRAEQQGRHDLKYLGYGEADVKLLYGGGSAVMRVVHPGGGSAYAISYTDQKRVESYQGGEKPQLELVGHYHKFNHGYPREVHTIQGGCTCDQTMFMRKKRLQAHVGYSIVSIKQDESGIVTRVNVEWLPFFDRGFYEKRF
jgi:hypothetical protein